MTDTLNGSCLCGAVTFQCQGEVQRFYFCHCSRCRKGTGSSNAANLFVAEANLNWQQGEQLVQRYLLPESRHGRSFCRHCGSPLPTVLGNSGMVMVPAGSLDSDVTATPTAHIFMASRANWDHDLETVPAYAAFTHD